MLANGIWQGKKNPGNIQLPGSYFDFILSSFIASNKNYSDKDIVLHTIA
jgi:hypothetical protein